MNRLTKDYSKRNWHTEVKDKLTFGQRAADKMRNIMGSWGFVGFFCLLMAVWMTTEGFGIDKMPFILLNLALSTLAGLQGAILLIAAKRQDEISASLAQNDYATNLESERRIEELQVSIANLENVKHAEQIQLLNEILKVVKKKK